MSRNFSFNTGAGGVALYVSSNQNIGFHTNRPTERVQFGAGNAKFNSNVFVGQSVGVGTSNPVVTVDIRATDALLLPRGNTAQRPSSNIQGYIRYNTTTGQFEGLGAGDAWGSLGGVSATNQRTFVTACNDDTIRFVNSNAESARLTSQGRLGMGTLNPQFTLDIRATDAVLLPTGTTAQRPASNVQGLIRYNTDTSQFEGLGAGGAWGSLGGVKSTDQQTYIAAETWPTSNDGVIRFVNSNAETARLTPLGRLGLGTSNPLVALDIRATDAMLLPTGTSAQRPTGNSQQGYIRYNTDTSQFEGLGAGGAWGSLGGVSATNQRTFVTACNDDTIRFVNSNLETVRLTALGRLGLGTSNPTERLDVAGNAAVNSNLYVTGDAQVGGITASGFVASHGLIVERTDPVGTSTLHAAKGVLAASNGDLWITTFCNNPTTSISFRDNTYTEFARLTNQGYLGLAGQSNPAASLHVAGAGIFGTAFSNVPAAPSNGLIIQGNVGIGLSNPSTALHVAGTVTATQGFAGNATTATILQTARTINGVSFDGSANIALTASNPYALIAGTYLTGNAYDGAAAATWAVDATSTNTANKVVARNANGGFAAGVITASNVGIGLSNPTFPLHVAGNVRVEGNLTTGNASVGTAYSNVAAPSDGFIVQGNVGIGLSNPSTALHVAGTVTATGGFAGNASTATTLQTARTINGVSFNGSANIALTASNPFALTAGSYLTGTVYDGGTATTWAVDATSANTASKVVARDASGGFAAGAITASNIGIGTSNSTFRLHVLGDARIQGNLTVNGTQTIIDTNVSTTERIDITNDGTGPALKVTQLGTQPIADFYDDSSVLALRIADGGSVGVGTSNPGSRLAVAGNATVGASYSNVAAPTNGLIIQGNVGIGVTNPLAPLHVNGVIQANIPIAIVRASAQTTTASAVTLIPFNNVIANPTSDFNTSTYRFTPQVPGYYHISAVLEFAVQNGVQSVMIYKNGARWTSGGGLCSASYGSFPSAVSTVLYLNGSTDYVSIYAYTANASSLLGTSDPCIFTAFLITRA